MIKILKFILRPFYLLLNLFAPRRARQLKEFVYGLKRVRRIELLEARIEQLEQLVQEDLSLRYLALAQAKDSSREVESPKLVAKAAERTL